MYESRGNHALDDFHGSVAQRMRIVLLLDGGTSYARSRRSWERRLRRFPEEAPL